MVCVCWFFLVVMAFVYLPGWGTACLDRSICSNLNNRGNLLKCIHLCLSVIQDEFPEQSVLSLKENDDEDLLSIVLAKILSGEKTSELKAHNDQRRSYSMEHFRWGKPSGRKRRPVKVFTSSLEGGGSYEGTLPFQARRQLSINEEEVKDDPEGESQQSPVSLNTRAVPKPQAQLSPQHRKDGTYRMSHFRWGSPPKRNGSLMKNWEKKSQGQLPKLLRNILDNDVQRIIG